MEILSQKIEATHDGRQYKRHTFADGTTYWMESTGIAGYDVASYRPVAPERADELEKAYQAPKEGESRRAAR